MFSSCHLADVFDASQLFLYWWLIYCFVKGGLSPEGGGKAILLRPPERGRSPDYGPVKDIYQC